MNNMYTDICTNLKVSRELNKTFKLHFEFYRKLSGNTPFLWVPYTAKVTNGKEIDSGYQLISKLQLLELTDSKPIIPAFTVEPLLNCFPAEHRFRGVSTYNFGILKEDTKDPKHYNAGWINQETGSQLNTVSTNIGENLSSLLGYLLLDYYRSKVIYLK